jgi:NADPH:quinone reductase
MNQAVRIQAQGAASVLQFVDVPLTAPGAGEVRIRHHAVGLNYIDVYHRSGVYPLPLPSGIGSEGAGIIEEVGEGVSHVKVGDRVAYAGGPIGAYAQARVMPAKHMVRLPDSISFETAASMMLKGMTVQYLLRRTFKVQAGQTILFHAAAGGVGLIAVQWAKALGATVIGTVGSDEKAALAKSFGCDHTINYRTENFAERVKAITNGAGVPVVYDSIGKDTFQGSLDCLSPFGTMVSFGNASGKVAPFELTALKGTLFITRPSLMPYTEKREHLDATSNELFDMVGKGTVKINIEQRYPLFECVRAHQELEARTTTGSSVLLLS